MGEAWLVESWSQHPAWWIAAGSLAVGAVLGSLRRGVAGRAALGRELLVLFALAHVVCDALRWAGLTSDWGVNPYTLCVGFGAAAVWRLVRCRGDGSRAAATGPTPAA